MKPSENDLTTLPNIGKALAEKLNLCGIQTVDDLMNLGSEVSFLKLASVDDDACINTLYALEGAVLGIRWHNINTSRKIELKAFFEQITINGPELNPRCR